MDFRGKLKKDMKNTAERVLLTGKNLSLTKEVNKGKQTPRKIPVLSTRISASRKKMTRILRRPPGYTWHKGGRLKEIRIRFLCRKFLSLWKQKTFGQLTYTDAKRWYEKYHKKLCFKAWKDEWWETAKEWKLEVRADYHFRYVAYSKVWVTWLTYHNEQQRKKALHLRATNHWNKNVLRIMLANWKTYAGSTSHKKVLQKKAEDFHNKNLHRQCLDKWVLSFYQVKIDKRNNEIALWHWINYTQRQCWQKWVQSHQERMLENQLILKADLHRQCTLLHNSFFNWMQYIVLRRQKKTLAEFASTIHRRTIARNSLVLWHKRLARKQNIRALENHIISSGKSFQCRRVFSAWKQYKKSQLNKHEKYKMASLYHRKQVLIKHFCRIREQVFQTKNKMLLKYNAQVHYKHKLIFFAFQSWVDRYDKRCDEKLKPAFDVANVFYRKGIMMKAYFSWREWISEEKIKKEKHLIAESHFIVKTLPKYFEQWKFYISKRKEKLFAAKQADEHFREITLYKSLKQWSSQHELMFEVRSMERMAILQNNEAQKRSYFKIWRKKLQIKRENDDGEELATNNYQRTICMKCFTHWKCYIETKKQRRQDVIKAAIFVYHKHIGKVFKAWKKFTDESKLKKCKNRNSVNHYQHSIQAKYYGMWQKHFLKKRRVRITIQTHIEKKHHQMTTKVFHAWKKFSQKSKENRMKSTTFYTSTLKRNVFKRWKVWNNAQLMHKQILEEKLNSFHDCKQKVNLQNLFQLWQESTIERVEENTKHRIAVCFYNAKLYKLTFGAWRLHRFIEIKKIILQERSEIFLSRNIMSRTFSKWKKSFAAKKKENSQTAKALWLWALNLEYKVFQKWIEYVQYRSRKKAEYNKALAARRDRMVKHACRNMLQYHSNVVFMHTQATTQSNFKLSSRESHLAWKMGMRWKNKTFQKLRSKQCNIEEEYTINKSTQYVKISENVPPACHNWIPECRVSIPPFSMNTIEQNSWSNAIHRPSPHKPDFLLDSLDCSDMKKSVHFAEPIVDETNHSDDSHESPKISHETEETSKNDVHKTTEYVTPVETRQTESSDLNLIPPSAFTEISSSSKTCTQVSSSGTILEIPNKCEDSHQQIVYSDCNTTQFSDLSLCSTMNEQSIQEEIEEISRKLQSFKTLKLQLRVLHNEKSSFQQFLQENGMTVDVSAELRTELNEMEREITEVQQKILIERPIIEGLSVRIQQLLQIQ